MISSDNFYSSALIGHLLSVNLIGKLIEKKIISIEDSKEIMDEALFHLEKHQSSFPESRQAFEEARDFFDAFVRWSGTTDQPNRATPPSSRHSRRKKR
jgi:hypothetical protein